jgi:hypothetical protein
MLHRLRIALAVIIMAVATVSAVDSASAQNASAQFPNGRVLSDDVFNGP